MRSFLFIAPMIIAVGCHRQDRYSDQTPTTTTQVQPGGSDQSGMTDNQNKWKNQPNQAATQTGMSDRNNNVIGSNKMAMTCKIDTDCGDQQLCLRSACMDITKDMAECTDTRVFFDTDSVDIGPTAKQRLDRISRCLKSDQSVHVNIAGNTDSNGTADYNQKLGDRRATAVANYLMAQGVSQDQLRTVSYGADNPLCYDQDQDCMAKNRRASIKKTRNNTASTKNNGSPM